MATLQLKNITKQFGDTKVICTVSVEAGVPRFLRGSGQGWITAEYGMLPRATSERTRREAADGKQSGRTVEIQRLIGRSLRTIINLEALGERQITVDCDVIQADGGTRTASISGAWVALRLAVNGLMAQGLIKEDPITAKVAAISCGIHQGTPVLDLDYDEDSVAEADGNFVLTGKGRRTLDKGLPETLGPVDVYDSLAGFVDQFLKDPS